MLYGGPPRDRHSYGGLRGRVGFGSVVDRRFGLEKTGFEFFAEPITVAFDVDRDRVMEHPIEDCGCDHAVPEHVAPTAERSEEHTSELQSRFDLVCRLL